MLRVACGRILAKILVIDDDRGIRHLLDSVLSDKSPPSQEKIIEEEEASLDTQAITRRDKRKIAP
jgi:hypothetical protein